jgi:hypothetical protein
MAIAAGQNFGGVTHCARFMQFDCRGLAKVNL